MMRKPTPPKKPSDLDMLLDRNADRRYHNDLADYINLEREYDRQRYGEHNNGPWGDGE